MQQAQPQLPNTALILSGGGARAAYQVGVLKAVSDILPKEARNPFPIICGTSAGAINAVGVATHASRFRVGVLGLEAVWRNFTAEQVYRIEMGKLALRATGWLSALFIGGLGAGKPVSLLDNSPLVSMLERILRFDRISQAVDAGDLRAVSITCSGYSSGESVSFFEGDAALRGWRRTRRIGVPTRLKLHHLLASAAIPAVFPAVRIHREYFGDGSVRQVAPLSPALHLGADKVMVIGVGSDQESVRPRHKTERYPSIAQIAGHVLNSAFLDALESDLERLERINNTLRMIPPEVRRREGIDLRPVEVLKIVPSQSLDQIAARHLHELPRSMRFFLRGSGAASNAGATLSSYLLFEAGFCRELIQLGYDDAIQLEPQILRFLGYDPLQLYGLPGRAQHDVC